MRQTFIQYLTESKIQIPQQTFKAIMNVVAAAYFSDLARRMRLDGEEPGKEFEQHLEAARAKYGPFELHNITKDHPALTATVPFDTKGLPERYRKNLTKDFAIKLTTGPIADPQSGGEYFPKTKGRAGGMHINTRNAGNVDAAVYMPKMIPVHLEKLESTVDHELQHMVQDVALQRLHPSQVGTADQRKNATEDEYYSSNEEFLPQITSAATNFMQSVRGTKDKAEIQSKFLDAVDPRRGKGVYPFFNAVYKADQQKWKKAVKEFHRLVQNKI
jgi:hypothetical protein